MDDTSNNQVREFCDFRLNKQQTKQTTNKQTVYVRTQRRRTRSRFFGMGEKKMARATWPQTLNYRRSDLSRYDVTWDGGGDVTGNVAAGNDVTQNALTGNDVTSACFPPNVMSRGWDGGGGGVLVT